MLRLFFLGHLWSEHSGRVKDASRTYYILYFSMVDLYILEAQRPRISYLKFIWSCVEEAPES